MINKIQQFIWKQGKQLCPECYRRLWDYQLDDADVWWNCHHCGEDTRHPIYSNYWPFGATLLRIKRIFNKGLQS